MFIGILPSRETSVAGTAVQKDRRAGLDEPPKNGVRLGEGTPGPGVAAEQAELDEEEIEDNAQAGTD